MTTPEIGSAAARGEKVESMSLLDVGMLAERLQVSPRTIWRLRDGGKIPLPVKIAGCVRWRESDITAWIAAGCPDVRRSKAGSK